MAEARSQFKSRITKGFHTFNEPGENFARAIDLILIPTFVFFLVMGYSLLRFQPNIEVLNNLSPSVSLVGIFTICLSLAALFPLQALGSVLFGWFLAGTWLRLRYGKRAQNLLIEAAKSIFAFVLIVMGMVYFPFLFVLGTVTFFFLLVLFLFVVFQTSISFLFLMLPAYVGAMIPFENYFGKTIETSRTKPTQYHNFLVLTGSIPPTPNEQIQYCPFKNKVQNTCTYLSYPTIDLPQICDYKSTFTRCYVYRKLMRKVEEIKREVEEK